jgi:hypothetical protein
VQLAPRHEFPVRWCLGVGQKQGRVRVVSGHLHVSPPRATGWRMDIHPHFGNGWSMLPSEAVRLINGWKTRFDNRDIAILRHKHRVRVEVGVGLRFRKASAHQSRQTALPMLSRTKQLRALKGEQARHCCDFWFLRLPLCVKWEWDSLVVVVNLSV